MNNVNQPYNKHFDTYNVGSTFLGAYLHHKDMPKETMFERYIEEGTKLNKKKNLMKLKGNNRR